MLIGEFIHSIDVKKRLAIPVRLRKEIGERVFLTKGLDKCLFLHPAKEWEKFTDKLTSLSVGQSDTRSLVRQFLAGAVEVEFDGLGRILIPDYLKEYAELKKNIAIVGVLSRLEILNLDNWNKYKIDADKNAEMIAEKLGELGLI